MESIPCFPTLLFVLCPTVSFHLQCCTPGLGGVFANNYHKVLQSVGIEPTLLRTRALSVRLNCSAKTANMTYIEIVVNSRTDVVRNLKVANVGRCYKVLSITFDSMAQWQRVGFQTRRLGVRFPLGSTFSFAKHPRPIGSKSFPRRDLNPGRSLERAS